MADKKRYLDASQIEAEAVGNWIYLFSVLTNIGKAVDEFNGSGSRTGAASNRSPCPVHGGSSGEAFFFYNDANNSGRGGCNTCGLKTGLNLIAWANGWGYRKALEKVADELDIESSQRPTRTTRKPQLKQTEYKLSQADIDRNEKIERDITALWSKSITLESSQALPARLYLKNRGLAGIKLTSNTMRYHPAAPLWVEIQDNDKPYKFMGYQPCILLQVQNKNGKPSTLHRTFITKDGNKALGDNSKKLMPAKIGVSISGGCVPLCKNTVSNVIGISEGMETSLAIIKGLGMPMACCINASMYGNWEPQGYIEYAFLWKDKDKPDKQGVKAGERVTKILKDRLEKRGITVFVMNVPLERDGVDWLDAYNEIGYQAFPDSAKNWATLLSS